jgi:hypothetical protein
MKFPINTHSVLLSVTGFCLVTAPLLSSAAASDQGAAHVHSAKAAAHASLTERADVPDHPPKLPDGLPEAAQRALPDAALRKKGDAVRRAKDEAQRGADDAAHAARADVANKSAQGSAASAARSGNADERAAAGQARARAARAAAGNPDHPGPGKGNQN